MNAKHLSVSALNTFSQCHRKYYYSNIMRWKPATESQALAFGTAWHALMEHLAHACCIDSHISYEEALDSFLAGGVDLTGDALCQFLAMSTLFGDTFASIGEITNTEAEFTFRLAKRTWLIKGFIDAMTSSAVVEYKTTASDISPDSFYWTRLKANMQAILYALATDTSEVIYVVAKKPALKRAQIPQLDSDGFKIVVDDATGERALNKNGSPRQSAGDGMTLVKRVETDDEYIERMVADITAHADSYYAVKTVYVSISQKLETWQSFNNFKLQLMALAKEAKRIVRADRAYTRNCTEFNCRNCPYAGLCLDIDYDPKHGVPDGFIEK